MYMYIHIFMFYLCVYVMSWWGSVCHGTCIDARGQLCKLILSFHLYVGSKAQTQVTRFAQEELLSADLSRSPRIEELSYRYHHLLLHKQILMSIQEYK